MTRMAASTEMTRPQFREAAMELAAKIDAALSAVPAPVSEEEDAAKVLENYFERLQIICERLGCEPGENRLDFLDRFSRLSRTEGEWRPDPKTVEMCIAAVETFPTSVSLHQNASHAAVATGTKHGILSAIRSLHPAEKE